MAKKKKYNGTNNDLQNIHIKHKICLLNILGNVPNRILTLTGGTILCDIWRQTL
jgi:hypothetical protein